MTDENDNITEEASQGTPEATSLVHSRFLFVDIAALRAKQLRRGAVSRLQHIPEDTRPEPRKPERIAMEEVRRGLISYDLPETPVAGSGSAS